MALRKQKGNMYDWVNYMWSPIRGKCSHDCSYCYMKRWGELPPLHLDEKDLETELGKGVTIFVCHTVDMFAADVPSEWIEAVLKKCNKHKNKYLFQSKNPMRMFGYRDEFPAETILGTTIETNRDIVRTKAPDVRIRANGLRRFSLYGYETMVTIEPIFDFDLDRLVELVMLANPEWVNIGADSKGHNLPEPSPGKVKDLIRELGKKTCVKLKGNLGRLTAKSATTRKSAKG